jgi:hypothetical protein
MRTIQLAIEWQNDQPRGRIEVINGEFGGSRVVSGKGTCKKDTFSFSGRGACRLRFTVTDAKLDAGPHQTRITLHNGKRSFTFFARDVHTTHPILIEVYGVAVLAADDGRSYAEIDAALRATGARTIQNQIDQEPEETFANAANGNRVQTCPTWLGLSRDLRFFEFGRHATNGYWGYIQPRFHSVLPPLPEIDNKPYMLNFAIGKGDACRHNITSHLDDGCLPIVRSIQREDTMAYQVTAFATLEKSPLSLETLRGSEWEACYPNTGGNMLSAEDREKIKDLIDQETLHREEETVLCIRIKAVNSGPVPHYAWFKTAYCQSVGHWLPVTNIAYDAKRGLSHFPTGRVYAISRLDGKPAPAEELAVLIQPGASATLEIFIPHQPLPQKRALKLAATDFDAKLDECRKFWRSKLNSGAAISVPEAAIDERIKAGLLHCDIAALGREPAGPVLATIGWYAPIGSESSPIIQFFDAMGWHKLAERSLEFFLARQRKDGFIQNFGGYQLETGPALWTMGEHFRHSRDTKWVRRIKPKLLKSCDYLLAWRDRNKKPALRGKGYGLIDGKVADPEDFFRSFMLNALSYVGLQRVGEMLKEVDPTQSRRLEREAREYREDIRTAFYESIARSPVIPLGDGTWIPTVPSWAEYPGPLSLYAEGGKWFTHAAFGARDSVIGALYLVMGEVLTAHEIGTDILLKSHQQLFTVRNAALTQPYYVRHDYTHLIRGEVKAFLKIYYNQLTALQDRQTYTFWEHYCQASQHKTHEEGWFLMQTRWMLWLEQGSTLKLLAGIPRPWMEDGKTIELNRVASYFGPLTLKVESHLAEGAIEADITLVDKKRLPASVVIRLPHPDGCKALRAEGGTYDPATETVTIKPFRGKAAVKLTF